MRYLGIDVGKKRVGLSLSDKGGLMAFPYQTILRELHGDEGCCRVVKEICDKELVDRVVVGIPLNMKGESTKETEQVQLFTEKLQRFISQPIIFENEVFSSKQASRSGNKRIDEKAASIVLQSYLDKLQN